MKNTKHTFRVTKNSEEHTVFLFPKLEYSFFSASSYQVSDLRYKFDEFCKRISNATLKDIRVYFLNTEERGGHNYYNHIGAANNIGYTNGRADYEYTSPITIRGQRIPCLVARCWNTANIYSDTYGEGITDGSQKKLIEVLGDAVSKVVNDVEVLEFIKKEAIENARKQVQDHLDDQFKRLQTAYEEFGLTTIVKKG